MSESRESRMRRLRFILICTAVFTLLAHSYRYLSMSFSGDAMLLSQTGEELYQTSLGRFLQPVYWQIRGYITAPLLIGLFATAFLSLSAAIIVSLFGITRPLHIALVCGVLAANETLAVSNATYLPWTDVYMLAMLFTALGVLVSFRHPRGWLIAPFLYCVSLGLYQSYLPVAATLVILLLLFKTLRGESLSSIWQRGLRACLSLLFGLLLYALVLRIVLSITGTQASNDYNGVGRVGIPPLHEIPALLLDTYLTPLRLLFVPDAPVMSWHVTTVPAELHLALFAFASVLLAKRFLRLGLHGRLTVIFLLAVLPLGMNFVQFIAGGTVSGLTIYAYHLLYLLPIALIEEKPLSAGALAAKVFALCRAACITLICLLLALNIRVSNQLAVKRDLEFYATTSAMARILDRAEQHDGYIPGETPVVLISMLPSSAISAERPGFETLAKAQGMRYTYGAAYETSNYWYLQMALGEPINLVSHDQRVELSKNVDDMPGFPAEGCCRMIDGYLYLKL